MWTPANRGKGSLRTFFMDDSIAGEYQPPLPVSDNKFSTTE